ncbi:MAG: LON peptidase substrate-binding domain-containing protein [Candidatus Cyclobacteriaceae bacterium M3_2C_046]
MELILPLFPLNIVAFPGENLNLHIFEPRYRDLINDALQSDQLFGIPSYVKNTIEFGTTARIQQIEKTYKDGRMDIKTKAEQVFEVIQYDNPYQEKLYAKGKIRFIENIHNPSYSLQEELIFKTREFLQHINMVGNVEIKMTYTSFDLGHKIGLTLEQEYDLLKLNQESQRQEYLIRHLDKILPVLNEVKKTKEKIKMNGHFRNFDPIDF